MKIKIGVLFLGMLIPIFGTDCEAGSRKYTHRIEKGSLGNNALNSEFDNLYFQINKKGDVTTNTYQIITASKTWSDYQTFGSSISLPSTGRVYLDGGASTYMYSPSANRVDFVCGNNTIMSVKDPIVDINVRDISINSTKKLYLDGGDNTYISEGAANQIYFVPSGSTRGVWSNSFLEIDGELAIQSLDKLYLEGYGSDTYQYYNSGDTQIYWVVNNVTVAALHATAGAGSTPRFYAQGEVNALSYVDRTPYPKTKQEAYDAVNSLGLNIEGTGVDHEKLSPFIKSISTKNKVKKDSEGKEAKDIDGNVEYEKDKDDNVIQEVELGRDLSATVSAQNEVIKDLIKRIEALESEVVLLKEKVK